MLSFIMKQDYTLHTLLDLDGTLAEIGEGYWVKIEAKAAPISKGKPKGIKYSLTLHAPNGERIFGMDNAHAVPGFKDSSEDHLHKSGKIKKYQYKDAAQLLEDFWNTVEKTIKER